MTDREQWEAPKQQEGTDSEQGMGERDSLTLQSVPSPPTSQSEGAGRTGVASDDGSVSKELLEREPEKLHQSLRKDFQTNMPDVCDDLQDVGHGGIQESGETDPAGISEFVSSRGLSCMVVVPDGKLRRVVLNDDGTPRRSPDGSPLTTERPLLLPKLLSVLNHPPPNTSLKHVIVVEP